MADRTIRVRLQAEIQSYLAGLRTASAATADFGKQLAGMGTARAGDIEKVGRAALLMGGAVAIGLGASAKAAIDWEAAWAGVTKTVEGSADELAGLEDGLRTMARELPATHGEIAAVAEAAGALGVATPAVESFTRTMIDLGETTDLTATQAAEAFARIANIMQTPQTEFDEMGSTVVELGNRLAATESEITEMALRIAGAGHQIGLTETDVLGFAGALSSVGIEAEAGGSAISRVFIKIDEAVRSGDESLVTFATTAGMSAEEFANAYRDNAGGAIVSFIEGLGRMSSAGENVFGVLDDLELSEIRVRDALLRAAGAGDLFGRALNIGATAWEENIALAEEAEKRYETTAAQFEILRNQIVDLGIDIGAGLLPILKGAAEGVSQLVTGFQALPGPLKDAATIGGVLATALLGTVGIVGTLAPKIVAARNALMTMGTAAQFLGRNLTLMMGIAGAAVAVIGAIAFAMGESAEKARAAEQRINDMALAMRDAGDAGDGLNSWLEQMLRDAPDLTNIFARAGLSIDDVGTALLGTTSQFGRFRDRIVDMAEQSGVSGLALDVVSDGLDRMRQEAIDAESQAGDLNTVLGESEGAGAAAEGGIDRAGGAAHDAAVDFEALEDAIKAYHDALRASSDPIFGVISAERRHADAQRNIGRSQQAVIDAQNELNEARSNPDATATDIRRAEERLVDATLAVEEAQLAAVESAYELEGAQVDLATAVATGTTTADDAIGSLQRLADQGLITQEQVDLLTGSFGGLLIEVQQLKAYEDLQLIIASNIPEVATDFATLNAEAGKFVDLFGALGVPLVPTPTDPAFDNLFGALGLTSGSTRYGSSKNVSGSLYGNAGGGFAGTNSWGPTDSIPTMLSPGEFVISAPAAKMLGPDTLYGLNSGVMPAPVGDPMLAAALAQMSGEKGFNLNIDKVVGFDTAGQVERGARRVYMAARS